MIEFENFPSEVKSLIVQFHDVESLRSLSVTCKDFHDIVNDEYTLRKNIEHNYNCSLDGIPIDGLYLFLHYVDYWYKVRERTAIIFGEGNYNKAPSDFRIILILAQMSYNHDYKTEYTIKDILRRCKMSHRSSVYLLSILLFTRENVEHEKKLQKVYDLVSKYIVDDLKADVFIVYKPSKAYGKEIILKRLKYHKSLHRAILIKDSDISNYRRHVSTLLLYLGVRLEGNRYYRSKSGSQLEYLVFK